MKKRIVTLASLLIGINTFSLPAAAASIPADSVGPDPIRTEYGAVHEETSIPETIEDIDGNTGEAGDKALDVEDSGSSKELAEKNEDNGGENLGENNEAGGTGAPGDEGGIPQPPPGDNAPAEGEKPDAGTSGNKGDAENPDKDAEADGGTQEDGKPMDTEEPPKEDACVPAPDLGHDNLGGEEGPDADDAANNPEEGQPGKDTEADGKIQEGDDAEVASPDPAEGGLMPDKIKDGAGLPGNESGESGRTEACPLQLPQELTIVIDPWEIDGMGQVYSERYVVQNTGTNAGTFVLSHLMCIPEGQGDVAVKGDKAGLHDSGEKALYLEMVFENGDTVAFGREDSGYEARLEPGDRLVFWFEGEVNENTPQPWQDGDIRIEMDYSWEADGAEADGKETVPGAAETDKEEKPVTDDNGSKGDKWDKEEEAAAGTEPGDRNAEETGTEPKEEDDGRITEGDGTDGATEDRGSNGGEDGDAKIDASTETDEGTEQDAGTGTDGEPEQDAGTETDEGTEQDAGTGTDGEPEQDAGAETDEGAEQDASTGTDEGPQRDAGAETSGSREAGAGEEL